MAVLGPGISWLDLHFLGRPHAIATGVIAGAGSVALVDPGPSTCLDTLDLGLQQQGARMGEVTDLLLTHIHLDHAGATGTILRRFPHIRVLVHERGAGHLIDPAKLLASAERLYGEDMDRLWGEVAPVPERSVEVLRGGERLEVGGRTFEVAYTPGHASHHVSYYDAASGVAFVGDTAGVCIDGGYVLPPTPPPDIDLQLWADSVARIERWAPQTLFLTHFGPAPSVRPHLQTLLANLHTVAGMVRVLLEEAGTDAERMQRFADRVRRELQREMTGSQVSAYDAAAPPSLLWLGLARYWRKQGVGLPA